MKGKQTVDCVFKVCVSIYHCVLKTGSTNLSFSLQTSNFGECQS